MLQHLGPALSATVGDARAKLALIVLADHAGRNTPEKPDFVSMSDGVVREIQAKAEIATRTDVLDILGYLELRGLIRRDSELDAELTL